MSIEKGLAQSNDSFQMIYLSEHEYAATEVLVIEGNPTLAMELQKILKSLGFQKIYLSRSGEEGINIFSELVEMGKITLVIIDDKLPDKNIKDVVKKLLEVHPAANIIVESSNDPKDPQIRELFDIGVMSQIQKPLKFQNIKNVILEMREENAEIEKPKTDIDEEIKFLLSPYKKISKKKITGSLNFQQGEIEQSLEKLEFAQKILPTDEIKQAICNMCGSDNVVFTACCPKCEGINVFPKSILECLKCKHTFGEKYEGMDKCPECGNTLNRKGLDYAKIETSYYCAECTNTSPELKYILECWTCHNKFKPKEAKWENTSCYKIKS